MRRTLGQIRIFLADNPLAAMASDRLSRRARAAVFLYRLSLRILAQWARDKCPQQAAALAFQTALSLVPVTAIAFTILRAVGSLDAQSQLTGFIAERIFPHMADVTAEMEEFSRKSASARSAAAAYLHARHLLLALRYIEKSTTTSGASDSGARSSASS